MNKTNLAGAFAAPLLLFVMALPSHADSTTAPTATPTTCKDGTTSTATGKGACSGHGGKLKAASKSATPAAATPAAASAAAASTAAGSTTCKDGTTSTATGKGACSGHGGKQKAAKATTPATTASAAAAPAATPAPSGAMSATVPAAATAAKSTAAASASAPTVTASNTDPAGATAKCKDGTYSKSKSHSGSCSHHGGVAEFFTAAQ